jgi:hypothetical protein
MGLILRTFDIDTGTYRNTVYCIIEIPLHTHANGTLTYTVVAKLPLWR